MKSNEKFTQRAEIAIERAREAAGELGHSYVGTEHLLLGILDESEGLGARILKQRGVEAKKLRAAICRRVGQGIPGTPEHGLTVRAQLAVEKAAEETARLRQGYIGTEHLLLGILRQSECGGVLALTELGLEINDIYTDIMAVFGNPGYNGKAQTGTLRSTVRRTDTKVLDQYSRDLTELAAEGKIDPVVGRGDEIRRTVQILSRRTKNNPVLVGEPGVGKTAVAEALAQAIADGRVPDELRHARLVSLDMASLISGTKYRGEFEERLKNIVRELSASKDVIAFIDEVHTLVGAGSAEGAIDASNLLKPALARGEIRLIGTTTSEEYHKTIEKDAALERRFQKIRVSEPDEQETEAILRGIAGKYEQHHRVRIAPDALRAAVTISVRTHPERHLPDKAIDLLDEACAAVHLEGGTQLRAQDIAQIARRFDGFRAAEEGEAAGRLMQLEQELGRTVIGQQQAIAKICRAVRRGSAGLRDMARPVAALLLTGPTGVGKTSVSLALSRALFGREGLIRIDLSEYQQAHDVSRLIGAPPGYKGYGEGGQLTEKIRRHPRSVVLFAEVAKAHPDVLRLLLRLLEDGRLTDSEGKSADFRHAVILLTSNLGSGQQGRAVGFGAKDARQQQAEEQARRILQPELAARLDDLIVFSDLTPRDCAAIAAQELHKLAQRCEARGTRLTWSAEAERRLGVVDGKRGARAVRDEVAKCVTDPLAGLLLTGQAGQCVAIQIQENRVQLLVSDGETMLSGA